MAVSQALLRRYVALTIVVAIAVTVVQALLIALVLRSYRDAINRRVGELSLTVEAIIIDEELEARRPWPAIEERLRERLAPTADDDEMAVYDGGGVLLARSTGRFDEIPPALSEDVRGRLARAGSIVVLPASRIGVVSVGAMREIGGRPLYLLRVNQSVRNGLPGMLELGVGALVLPMLLLGLSGAFAIMRLTGRQLTKVDRVLRMMASGDLSARMSLPVDPDTAGVVLSFNRMAEKVENMVEKLRRMDEGRRQLLADVTHELNTPLTSVLGYLETLCMEDLPLPPERRKHLTEVAFEEAVNLRALIEDLTTLSRLDAEGLPLERQRVELSAVAEKVVRRLSHLAESRGVPLRTELSPGVEVSGDPQRLDQVVRNLVENALRHTTPPGDVTVSVRRESPTSRLAIIEVRDKGAGIPPEELPKLGQRFLRLDRSRARHTGGRGLGLAITVGLVEAHGGKVEFESRQGVGTTVRVRLPLAEPVPSPSQSKVGDVKTAQPRSAPAAPEAKQPAPIVQATRPQRSMIDATPLPAPLPPAVVPAAPLPLAPAPSTATTPAQTAAKAKSASDKRSPAPPSGTRGGGQSKRGRSRPKR